MSLSSQSSCFGGLDIAVISLWLSHGTSSMLIIAFILAFLAYLGVRDGADDWVGHWRLAWPVIAVVAHE